MADERYAASSALYLLVGIDLRYDSRPAILGCAVEKGQPMARTTVHSGPLNIDGLMYDAAGKEEDVDPTPVTLILKKREGQEPGSDQSILIPADLRIGGRRYRGNLDLRLTPAPRYASVLSKVVDVETGETTTLAKALATAGIQKDRNRTTKTVAPIEVAIEAIITISSGQSPG
jgi:hypothetical protein